MTVTSSSLKVVSLPYNRFRVPPTNFHTCGRVRGKQKNFLFGLCLPLRDPPLSILHTEGTRLQNPEKPHSWTEWVLTLVFSGVDEVLLLDDLNEIDHF